MLLLELRSVAVRYRIHLSPGIQQALDLGADGVLIPYINTAEEARQTVSCNKYPITGTRSVYCPQRSMNAQSCPGRHSVSRGPRSF